ncbi:MAG: sensor histidine kinase [Caldilineaceae bacterium]
MTFPTQPKSVDANGDNSISLARACVPGLLLLGIELAGLLMAARLVDLEITPFSAGVALLIAGSGLVMPVLRPGADTRLAAILAVLLAGLLVVPFDLSSVNLSTSGPLLHYLTLHTLLRYLNGTLSIPVALHLVSGFPQRSPAAMKAAPSNRQLLIFYLISSLLTIGVLVVPQGGLRVAIGIPMIGWMIFLLALAHIQLIRVSREPDPAWLRSAHQARLLLLGFLLAEAPLLLRLLLSGLGWPQAIPYNTALLFQVFVPLTVAYAIRQHDLFEIDATVRRALAYTIVSAVLLGIYFGFTYFLSQLLSELLPQFQAAAILLGLVAAALAFRPLYTRLVRFVDKLFYPERLAFAQVIADVRARLQQVATRRQIVTLLEDDLPAGLNSLWGTLVFAPAHDLPGRRETPPAWNGRMIVGERMLGRYWLGPRRSGLAYGPEEQAQLAAVISQAGLALAYAEALEDLNELNRNLEREVLVQTAQVLDQQRALAVTEERQRLARDLHDSVTQTLFSISLGSRALSKLAPRDPQATAQGLVEQEAAAQQALAEMRALLAQLRSPLLAEGDLTQALRAHCAQLAGLGLTVRLEISPEMSLETSGGLPVSGAVSSELLNIAREALHNTLKHAGVSTAICCLAREADEIVLTVQDAGGGFATVAGASRPGHGLGLHSMAERAEKIGGTLTIDALPGQGTTVTVRVSQANASLAGQ